MSQLARRFEDTVRVLALNSNTRTGVQSKTEMMLNHLVQGMRAAGAEVEAVNTGKIRILQGDFREIDLPARGYDIILAAAVLHHLRDDQDWESSFEKIYRLTAPGGSVWITDLVAHETEPVQALMWQRYGDYLCAQGGENYRAKVFEYIDKEDSPRPVTYQLDLLRHVGFDQVELLHKNCCFAAFGAIKTAR
ncbi:MAG: class I SAM-dependent methyltransferase [Deltaproteobacteria bacterium]|jgi:tRNA (cmo5U34)-methyltransferase|nr:class I SAM-dependent methyltransferase [Deltaproteobacteria bacterium]